MPVRPTTADTESLEAWLTREPFTLALSAGFFGFFAHAGMLSALEERGITPSRLTGSSAGALVAGGWASGVPATDLANVLCGISREDFWDPALGLGLLRGAQFRELLHNTLGCSQFEECRAPLAVSAWRVGRGKTEIFEGGDLASAIHASCCFPGLLQPVSRNQRLYLDGGIADRPGLASVSPGARVFHHHLASKSPWRFALPTPLADEMTTLSISGLPRLSPFDLTAGSEAFEKARASTREALDGPVSAQINATAGD